MNLNAALTLYSRNDPLRPALQWLEPAAFGGSSVSVQNYERQRASRRLKIFLPATLRHGAEEARIHLLDISRTGALAHADNPPKARDRVRIQCDALYITGTVAWVAGKRFGVMFSAPLAEAMIRAIIDAELPKAMRAVTVHSHGTAQLRAAGRNSA
jgi:hypothetical protein